MGGNEDTLKINKMKHQMYMLHDCTHVWHGKDNVGFAGILCRREIEVQVVRVHTPSKCVFVFETETLEIFTTTVTHRQCTGLR